MLEVCILFSGSKGNSTLVRTSNTAILLDAGLTAKRVSDALDELGMKPGDLSGIVVSHEHSDHVSAIDVLTRRHRIPLYITERTLKAGKEVIKNPGGDIIHFSPGDSFAVGDLRIEPFLVTHDAAECCGFVFTDPALRRLGLATDSGYATQLMIRKLGALHTLVLESNHDVRMLMDGPYPWALKQRIRSRMGHLSNEQAASVVQQVIHPDLHTLILAHLSETNNDPDLARTNMQQILDLVRHEATLLVGEQRRSSGLIRV